MKHCHFPLIPLALLCLGATAADDGHPIRLLDADPVINDADGGLRWLGGVHNIQVYRANRSHAAHADGLNHTYLHAPNLAYWNNRFYLQYLSAPVSEHEIPTDTSLTVSTDGYNWDAPRLLFPAIQLPDGSYTLTHQRMGFYVASDGRLLTLAFHGEAPSPNDGRGIGRVVREIYADGSFGPIYFIRYNSHPEWDPAKAAAYPFYQAAPDPGFIAACDELLANKLITAQWWEEDRSEDGFYRVSGRALSWFRQPDNTVVGIWKNAQMSVTTDAGESWTRTGFAPGFHRNGSKYWAQQTADGRYAIAYNPTSRLRHPLAVTVSADGSNFRGLWTIHGELPEQRFPGLYKNMGPQYVRGIVPGNGNPPGDDLWITYSVNKEDIWVSRIPVPLQTTPPADDFFDDFDAQPRGLPPRGWNSYSPLWAPVVIVDASTVPAPTSGDDASTTAAEAGKATAPAAGGVLRLSDRDPADHAAISRVFAPRRSVLIRFKLLAAQLDGRLEVDVASIGGQRPVQIAFSEKGEIMARHEGMWKHGGRYPENQWIDVEIDINPGNNIDRFQLRINGAEVLYRIAYFSDFPRSVERLTLRTGAYRQRPASGPDPMPAADTPTTRQTFYIDDVSIILRSDD